MKLSFTDFFHCEILISFCFFSDHKVWPNIFQIKGNFDAPPLQKIIVKLWLVSLTKVSVSKSCFYNDCVSHPETDKTLTDGRFSYQY